MRCVGLLAVMATVVLRNAAAAQYQIRWQPNLEAADAGRSNEPAGADPILVVVLRPGCVRSSVQGISQSQLGTPRRQLRLRQDQRRRGTGDRTKVWRLEIPTTSSRHRRVTSWHKPPARTLLLNILLRPIAWPTATSISVPTSVAQNRHRRLRLGSNTNSDVACANDRTRHLFRSAIRPVYEQECLAGESRQFNHLRAVQPRLSTSTAGTSCRRPVASTGDSIAPADK